MEIRVKTVPHSSQRYPTVGDWWWSGDTLQIRVSEMGNWKYEMLVALHEAVETLICKDRGIKEEDVSAFDIQFEKEREEGKHSAEDEPGDATDAPYRQAHFVATNIERILADALGVDWKKYDDTVVGL